MRFNKLIISLLAIVPYTLATRNEKCSKGKSGICISTDTCKSYGGTSSRGFCPNDPNNVRCCDAIPCKHEGMSGTCKFTNECSGKSYAGHCPGGKNFQCCVPKKKDTTKGVGESCTYNGVSGHCINTKTTGCTYDIATGVCPGPAHVRCCLSSKVNEKMVAISQKMKRIIANARENLSCCNTLWQKSKNRQCKRNSKVYFTSGEPKCNLFVYEILLASGIDIGTPNRCSYSDLILRIKDKCDRPPTTSDWYHGRVKHFKFYSKTEGAYKPGDIITDGHHVGIVSGNGKTISASTNPNKVVENDWCFRKGQNCRVYRYSG